MDIKDLNKSQLLLLAILLSFIVSIATGITTVTLMEQAPTSITVPINRIIQQTVEKIVPVEGKTTVETVIIKEEDLVVDAIAKNQSAVFIVTKKGLGENGDDVEIPTGRGMAVSNEGIIVTDSALVNGPGDYFVQNSSGKFQASFLEANSAGFAFLKAGAPVDPKDKLTFTVPTFLNLKEMKVGQKVIIFGRSISSFIFEGSDNLKANLGENNGGAMLINLNGQVLGLALSGGTAFASASQINEALKSLQ